MNIISSENSSPEVESGYSEIFIIFVKDFEQFVMVVIWMYLNLCIPQNLHKYRCYKMNPTCLILNTVYNNKHKHSNTLKTQKPQGILETQ